MTSTQRSLFLRRLLPFSLSGAIIAADQATKSAVVAASRGTGGIISDVFGNGFLLIVHVRNRVIAFSIGEGLPESLRTLLFVVLPLAALAALIFYCLMRDTFGPLQRWALAGVVGGGLGNLIDRIFRPGGVVDFVSVKFYGFLGLSRWPTFNLADACIVVSGILLFATILFSDDGKGPNGIERKDNEQED